MMYEPLAKTVRTGLTSPGPIRLDCRSAAERASADLWMDICFAAERARKFPFPEKSSKSVNIGEREGESIASAAAPLSRRRSARAAIDTRGHRGLSRATTSARGVTFLRRRHLTTDRRPRYITRANGESERASSGGGGSGKKGGRMWVSARASAKSIATALSPFGDGGGEKSAPFIFSGSQRSRDTVSRSQQTIATHQRHHAVDGPVETIAQRLHALVGARVVIAQYVVLHGGLHLGQILAHPSADKTEKVAFSISVGDTVSYFYDQLLRPRGERDPNRFSAPRPSEAR